MGEEEPKIPQGTDRESLVKRLDEAFLRTLDSEIKSTEEELMKQLEPAERRRLQSFLEKFVGIREGYENLRKQKEN